LEASTGFRYNAAASYLYRNQQDRYAQRFSASYVTGSHSFKAGLQVQEHIHNQIDIVNGDVQYTFTRGVPTRITQWATPFSQKNRTKADLGLYAQDQWTIKRLTLNYGVRVDYFHGRVLPQHIDAGQFVGARDFAAVDCVPCWTDLNPRFGASYDLFGKGRTALKASLGRYVGRETTVLERANNPVATSINSVNRTWNNVAGDYIPHCDLRNPAANGECGPIDNVNFGKLNPNAVKYADDMIRGFGVRDYFWDLLAEVQHELGPRVSLRGGYYRNWSDHFGALPRGENTVGVVHNLALTPADFEPFCITAPFDPRLPGGGGYPVCAMYDIKPEKFGQGQLLVTRASHYGNGKHRHSDFFSAVINTRLGNGVEFGASLDTGRTVEDLCFVVDSPQYGIPVSFNVALPLLNCHLVTPFRGQTELKVHGAYPLPAGFVVSGILQNLSGVPYEAYYAARNDEIAPSLGRNLAACGTRAVCTATAIVPLLTTRTQFEPRRTVIDLRLTKILSLGPTKRLRANFDVYNVLNDGSVLVPNNNYGPFWRQPGAGLSGGLMVSRLIQFSGELSF
jgi:hypothetical protein